MANNKGATGIADLVGALEQALNSVKASKEALDKATAVARDAQTDHQNAIKAAQKARSEYDAHVNEAMSGFAQIHQ